VRFSPATRVSGKVKRWEICESMLCYITKCEWWDFISCGGISFHFTSWDFKL